MYSHEEILDRIGFDLLFFEEIGRNLLVFIFFDECVEVLEHSARRTRSRHEFNDIVVFFVLVELPDKVFYLVFIETDDAFPDCGWCDQVAESKSVFKLNYLIFNLLC